MDERTATLAGHGWQSPFPEFKDAAPRRVREALHNFVTDASDQQVRAWDASIPALQSEVAEVLESDAESRWYSAILEYELPMAFRRPDVVFLVRGPVLVIELKGKVSPSQADLDQAAAYARDLRCYHRACHGREVVPILVPTRARGYLGTRQGVHVAGTDALDGLVEDLTAESTSAPIPPAEFLAEDAYRPLPTLVQAARELIQRLTVSRRSYTRPPGPGPAA